MCTKRDSLAVGGNFFSGPRCWGSMRNCKLNLCHGQQISDFVLHLFAIFEDFSLSPSTDLCSPFDARTCRCNNRTTPGAGPSKAAQKLKKTLKTPLEPAKKRWSWTPHLCSPNWSGGTVISVTYQISLLGQKAPATLQPD
jgi:hypothetical protein